MIIFQDPDHKRHAPAKELKSGIWGAPNEHPGRLDSITNALHIAGMTISASVSDHGLDPILAVHDQDYVLFLEEAWAPWRAEGRTGDIIPLVWPGAGMRRDVSPQTIDGCVGQFCFDSGTPITRGTYAVAYKAAQCAASAADAILEGSDTHAVCLTRPPGHHAMPAAYGGYCFFNQAAVAAQRLRDGGAKRVTVLDVDYHHGNGTQAIFYDRSDVLVVNIHADPDEEYPYFLGHADETGEGKGAGFNYNLPLPKGTCWKRYVGALDIALQEITNYGPDALVVSLGLDTGEHDPLGYFSLNADNFADMGRRIRMLDKPMITVLEGGYNTDNLGKYLLAYMGL